jgi:hypothetical protein
LCGWLLLAAGCSEAPEPPAARRSPTPAAAAPAASGATAAAVPAAPQEVPSDYRPPFPERTELFAPPNAGETVRAARRTVVSDVTLKGIIEFGGRRALVEIGGLVYSLREQEQRSGVKVVSIDHPRVTLERGDQRWTASLYEPR